MNTKTPRMRIISNMKGYDVWKQTNSTEMTHFDSVRDPQLYQTMSHFAQRSSLEQQPLARRQFDDRTAMSSIMKNQHLVTISNHADSQQEDNIKSTTNP